MGTGLEIAAAAAALGGTALSYSAQQKAASEKKTALLNGINAQADIQKKANTRTDDLLDTTYDSKARLANYEDSAATKEASLGSMLASQSATGTGDVTASTAGNVSDAYTRARADATAATSAKSRTLAKLLARSGAGGGLLNNEALAGADYSSDMLGFGAQTKANSNLTNVNMGSAASSGNGLALLGGLLSGSSGAIAGYGNTTKLPSYNQTAALDALR